MYMYVYTVLILNLGSRPSPFRAHLNLASFPGRFVGGGKTFFPLPQIDLGTRPTLILHMRQTFAATCSSGSFYILYVYRMHIIIKILTNGEGLEPRLVLTHSVSKLSTSMEMPTTVLALAHAGLTLWLIN